MGAEFADVYATSLYGAGSHSKLADISPLGQHYVIAKHVFMMFVGIAFLIGLFRLDYRIWKKPWLNRTTLIVGLGLVALTFTGDRHINRWITIFGFSVQPIEAAKIALIFFLAERTTSLKKEDLDSWKQIGLILLLGPLPLIVLLILQPNFGNVLVVLGLTLVALWVSGTALRKMAVMAGVLAAGALSLVPIIRKLGTRFSTWQDGWTGGEFGYQVKQSLIGLGAGGWRGLGVGQSHNKFSFLPESHTDFIYSVVGEEWGLVGTLGVIAAIVIIAWRGYGIAARCPEPFGRTVAAGLTTGLAIYGVANIGMVTALFPVIGLPLPFVSYGGTAMVGALASVGILLNIDRSSRSFHLWRRRWDRT